MLSCKFNTLISHAKITLEERRKFLYDNVANPDFCRKLLQMVWDNENIDEVLQLATDGRGYFSRLVMYI